MGKVGRPRVELTDEHIALIERLAGLGLTQSQIADCLPVSERTLRYRLTDPDDPAVSAAYARGRALDAEELSNRHRDIAMGRSKSGTIPFSEQRKALEFRLERHHGMPALVDHRHEITAVTRTVVMPDGTERSIAGRVALTNGRGGNGKP